MSYLQLIINPGSTSTKLALYRDETELAASAQPFAAQSGADLRAQLPARLQSVRDFLDAQHVALSELDNIMCRGGMLWGLGVGGYRVNDALAKALLDEEYASPHASDLGGVMGKALADEAGISAYIYDAVTAASLPPSHASPAFRTSCAIPAAMC